MSGTAQSLTQKVTAEVQEILSLAAQGIVSCTWFWPIRGIYFAATHPEVLFSVKGALLKSLASSTIIFAVVAFFTYLPQMAILAIFTGPLSPFLALILVGAESLVILSYLARPLFLEPALSQLFDATLVSQGQGKLVKDGKTRVNNSSRVGSALVRPLQALSKDGILHYILSLPLNFVPVVGTVVFLLYNGDRSGSGWHQRYFQLKGFSKTQKNEFVSRKRAEYAAFGTVTLLFNFIPVVGLVFSFTNTIGAALWAAQLEAHANIIDGEGESVDKPKSQ